jgi:hypothetical protein
MEISGLSVTQCVAVLDALTRAGLMARLRGTTYVRTRID